MERKRWTDKELRRVAQLRKEGRSFEEIAGEIGRTPKAVSVRFYTSAARQKPRTIYVGRTQETRVRVGKNTFVVHAPERKVASVVEQALRKAFGR
jgi:IS30 family transposase